MKRGKQKACRQETMEACVKCQQLFAWRRKAIASGVVAPLGGSPSRPVKFTRFESMRSDTVEIVIGDVVVRPIRLDSVVIHLRRCSGPDEP